MANGAIVGSILISELSPHSSSSSSCWCCCSNAGGGAFAEVGTDTGSAGFSLVTPFGLLKLSLWLLVCVPLLNADAALLTRPFLFGDIVGFVSITGLLDELDCKNWLLIFTLPPLPFITGLVVVLELVESFWRLGELSLDVAAALFYKIILKSLIF